MATLTSGINRALSALLANQQAIEITEHNVANANTAGYHRQEAVFATGYPYPYPSLTGGVYSAQMGNGVTVDRIRRFNLDFYDGRLRRETAEAKRWETEYSALQQVESVLAETTSDGLVSKIDEFFTGWQTLSDDPTNMALRADLIERSESLADAFNWRADALTKLRSDQDLTIRQDVDEINNLATQVAKLNSEIGQVKSAGDAPNDLLDKRDLLLDRLSELTGATANIQDNGQAIVSINGHALVVNDTTFSLVARQDTNNQLNIYWENDVPADPTMPVPTAVASIEFKRGELAGLFNVRDEIIPAQQEALNTLAQSIADQVNAVHSGGYGLDNTTGDALFTYDAADAARSFRVNTVVSGDPRRIAAANNSNSPGDGNNAIDMVALQNSLTMNGGVSTFNQYYTGKIGELGLAVSSASTRAEDRQLVADSLSTIKESAVGVSLDEEATNLIKYQKAYQAAARMMTAMDEMLNTIINGMGLVGR